MYNYDTHLIDPRDYGYVHKDDLPDMDAVIDWVHGIIEAVYETHDSDALDNCIEELAHELDIPFHYLTKRQAVS